MFRSTKDRWIIVGLGNPGPEYERTRHNIGAMVIGELALRVDKKPSSINHGQMWLSTN